MGDHWRNPFKFDIRNGKQWVQNELEPVGPHLISSKFNESIDRMSINYLSSFSKVVKPSSRLGGIRFVCQGDTKVWRGRRKWIVGQMVRSFLYFDVALGIKQLGEMLKHPGGTWKVPVILLKKGK